MLFAILGYVLLVLACWLCAYMSAQAKLNSITVRGDRHDYFRSMFRVEGFNRSLLMNLSLGSLGVCWTILPGDWLPLVALSVVLGFMNVIFAYLVSNALQDLFERLDDGPRYKKVKTYRTLVFILVLLSIVLGLIRFCCSSVVG